MVKNALCRRYSSSPIRWERRRPRKQPRSPRCSSAAWGNSKLFELWTSKFKSTHEKRAACDVMPSVGQIFWDFSGRAGRPRPFHISRLPRCLLLIGNRRRSGIQRWSPQQQQPLVCRLGGSSAFVFLVSERLEAVASWSRARPSFWNGS